MNNSSGEIGFVLGLLAVFTGQVEGPWGLLRGIVCGACQLEASGSGCRLAGAWGEGSLGMEQCVHKGRSRGVQDAGPGPWTQVPFLY